MSLIDISIIKSTVPASFLMLTLLACSPPEGDAGKNAQTTRRGKQHQSSSLLVEKEKSRKEIIEELENMLIKIEKQRNIGGENNEK